jgi:hypothetical protein
MIMKAIMVKGEGLEDEMDFSHWEEEHEVVLVVYQYHSESYEGWGNAIASRKGKWYHVGLGHCSCNDPVYEEEFLEGEGYASLKAFRKAATKECLDELRPLLEWLDKHHFK